MRLRRVGASLGLLQLQTDAADWTVYASYAALGLLHACAAAVSQRVLGKVDQARKQGERYHEAKERVRRIALEEERLQNEAKLSSLASSPSLLPDAHGALGKRGSTISGVSSKGGS